MHFLGSSRDFNLDDLSAGTKYLWQGLEGNQNIQERFNRLTENQISTDSVYENWKRRAAAIFNSKDSLQNHSRIGFSNEFINHSCNLLEDQARQSLIQTLVNVEAMNNDELNKQEPEDESQGHKKRKSNNEDCVLKVEEDTQSGILNSLIKNLTNKDPNEEPPIMSLLERTENVLKRSENKISESCDSQLATILRAMIGHDNKEGIRATNKPIQQSIVNDPCKIKFGNGWIREVDVRMLEPNSDLYSNRSDNDDDSEFSFILPISGSICVVRLQATWDGTEIDEDILWDMTEIGDSIDVFVESYIRETGMPRNPVGTGLLQTFRRQVEAARSFQSIFEIVCKHLQIKLGHSNVKQLPGITRKIIIDCLHEGLRVIDAVTWNLTNSIFEARDFLRSLIKDLNLPTSFMSVLFAAFVRAIAKERLKFIDECSNVLLGNVRAEILCNNAWDIKKQRKRGHGGTTESSRTVDEGSSSLLEESDGNETKRLRISDSKKRTPEDTKIENTEEETPGAPGDLDEIFTSEVSSSDNEETTEERPDTENSITGHPIAFNDLSVPDINQPSYSTNIRNFNGIINQSISGKPIFPLTLKPTAVILPTPGSSPFTGRVVPTRVVGVSPFTRSQQSSFTQTPDQAPIGSDQIENALSSIGSVVLRNACPLMSQSVFTDALINPTGLTTGSQINEETQ